MTSTPAHFPIPDGAAGLPVAEALPALDAALRDARRAVLTAPPGSGKTTLLPLALRNRPWLAGQRIIVLEPRRVAARASAARMAALLGERVGETVGYQVRFDRRIGPATRIEVITEGLLTRRLQTDPELPGVGLVIFDEFHERSLDVDLALALTLEVCATLRDDLRLLVMSATLQAEAVAALLGDAPLLHADGRLHPVRIQHHAVAGDVAAAVARQARELAAVPGGDVLAFLPGQREIHAAARALAGIPMRVLPLHGGLSAAEQDQALMPLTGERRLILATNIAQTSLTVEGVDTVIDGGWARVARFDAAAGTNRLDTERISRAAAEQRAGRAGRLGPGHCHRLWSQEQHGRLPAHDSPEMIRADLARFVLELAAWGARDPGAVALSDPPPAAAWQRAVELLRQLGAVDGDGAITAHGRALLRLAAPPRIGHGLLRAHAHGLAGEAAWVAALIEQGAAAGRADLTEWAQQLRATPVAANLWRSARHYLRQLGVRGIDDMPALQAADLARVIAWMYPERLARARPGQRGVYACVDGGEARLDERDPLAAAEWLAVAHWQPGEARRIRLAAPIARDTVLADHAAQRVEETVVVWDAREQAVLSERRRRLGALLLDRHPLSRVDGEAQRAAMLIGIRDMGLDVLPWTDAAHQLQARIASLRSWRPDEGWPDVSGEGLMVTLDEWLGPWLDGITRRSHLARLNLSSILAARLDYPQQQRLDRLAPPRISVPSGSAIRLDYQLDGAPPVLAVKLQELFGLQRTPCVDDGRMPVLLHLLSPARRPIQVTRDLASFWSATYAEVRKDLKGRYPKHPWPDDPLTALPTARARPRR